MTCVMDMDSGELLLPGPMWVEEGAGCPGAGILGPSQSHPIPTLQESGESPIIGDLVRPGEHPTLLP